MGHVSSLLLGFGEWFREKILNEVKRHSLVNIIPRNFPIIRLLRYLDKSATISHNHKCPSWDVPHLNINIPPFSTIEGIAKHVKLLGTN